MRNDGPIRVQFHQGTLQIRGIDSADVERIAQHVPLVWDDRDDVYRCDAMWASRLQTLVCTGDASPPNWDVLRGPATIAMPDHRRSSLRPDQIDAVAAFENGDRRGVLVMPTGTGKTVVAIDLIIRFKVPTLVVVPVRDLMYQWHDRIRQSTGVDAGLIGDGVHRVRPLSVTTYDSAAIHMPRIGDQFALVIFDEVHHLSGAWRSDAARMAAAPARLGLTATPPRDPVKLAILDELVGPVLIEQSLSGAAGRTLAEYSVRRIVVRMSEAEAKRYRDLSDIVRQFVFNQRELQPDFRWEDIYKLTAATDDDPQRAASAIAAVKAFRGKRQIEERAGGKLRILEDLFRLHAGEPVLVFTGSNVMAREISLRFMVPCLLSHCAKQERRDVLEGFESGRYPVLVANRVLDEGVDLPNVKTAIVLGGLSSQRQAIQRLGRVLRRGRGDRLATLYEVVTEDTKEVQRSRDRRRNEAYRPGASP